MGKFDLNMPFDAWQNKKDIIQIRVSYICLSLKKSVFVC